MVSTTHPNAAYYFNRDVECVQTYFIKHYGLQFEGKPELDVEDRTEDLDKEVRASGFLKNELGDKVAKAFEQVEKQYHGNNEDDSESDEMVEDQE